MEGCGEKRFFLCAARKAVSGFGRNDDSFDCREKANKDLLARLLAGTSIGRWCLTL
jgi:hypothetical protein